MSFEITEKMYNEVIKESFDKAFDHYKDFLVKTILDEGGVVPLAFVMEMTPVAEEDLDEDTEGFEVAGKTWVLEDAIKERGRAKDALKEISKHYAKNVIKSEALPSSIILASEIWFGEGSEPRPLQDKNGNGINGAIEKFMISGLSATQRQHIVIYDIVKDKEGKITDLVIDKEHTKSINDAPLDKHSILFDFYVDVAKEVAVYEKLKDMLREK